MNRAAQLIGFAMVVAGCIGASLFAIVTITPYFGALATIAAGLLIVQVAKWIEEGRHD